MKRKKMSNPVEDGPRQTSIQSIPELPIVIWIDILSRLPVKTLFNCRCVCTSWLHIISDPQFAKTHLAMSQHCPLLLPTHPIDAAFSRTVFLIEGNNGNNLNAKINLNSILYLPKCDPNPKIVSERDFSIVNSCNGLLCLSKSGSGDPVIVCNPITGEYITLPEPMGNTSKLLVSGLGFISRTNQYKVMRMFVLVINGVIVRWVVQNHTIGTGSWTRIHYLECPLPCRPTPWNGIFLNGAINWFCNDRRSSKFIVAFDFENERFQVVPPPPPFGAGQKVDISEMKMGILGGSLCISHFSPNGHLDVWVMMDYGVQGSWTKAISIGTFPSGLYQRIKYQNNGEILMFNRGTAPVSYNPVRKSFSYLKFHGIVSDFEAIAHIPSFVSLKDVVVGDTVVVLNVKSR